MLVTYDDPNVRRHLLQFVQRAAVLVVVAVVFLIKFITLSHDKHIPRTHYPTTRAHAPRLPFVFV